MGQYIKKTIGTIVDAIQWTGRNTAEVLAFLGNEGTPDPKTGRIIVNTPGGKVPASQMNFILRTELGEYYVMEQSAFLRNYEDSEDETDSATNNEDYNQTLLKELKAMTVDELKAEAAENNVDLGQAEKKADIVALLYDAFKRKEMQSPER